MENKCCFTDLQDVISSDVKQAESNLILEECSSHETKGSKKGRKGNPNAELVVTRLASKRNIGVSKKTGEQPSRIQSKRGASSKLSS